ncbi:MAG: deoxyribose-phosphate aldolase [Desulfotomaculum sp.]|nr:deoxyribose-phosphate aldolase [Desulfotomaculum sp.]
MVESLAQMIDHTLLKPDATKEQIIKLVEEAKKYKFAAVCVNPVWVKTARELLEDNTGIKVATVVGFPLGAATTEVKAFETSNAVNNGAEEIDMVINIGALKDGQDDYVERDIKAVVDAAEGKAIVKVIIETSLLNEEEKVRACRLAVKAGAHFVKTSTGFSKGGAVVEDVALMRRTVGREVGVKASGGIRTRQDALAMIEAGATRIGTSSGVEIVTGK